MTRLDAYWTFDESNVRTIFRAFAGKPSSGFEPLTPSLPSEARFACAAGDRTRLRRVLGIQRTRLGGIV